MARIPSLALVALLACLVHLHEAMWTRGCLGGKSKDGICKKEEPEDEFDGNFKEEEPEDEFTAQLTDAYIASTSLLYGTSSDVDEVQKKLQTVANAEDIGFEMTPMPAKASELLALAENKDANCGNEHYERRFKQLLTHTASKNYTVLFNYLDNLYHSHRNFCSDHPRETIIKLRKQDPAGWLMILECSGRARRDGLIARPDSMEGRFDPLTMQTLLVEPMTGKVDWMVMTGGKLAESQLNGKVFESTFKQLLKICESYQKTVGHTLRNTSEQTWAGVPEAERAQWKRHLQVCNTVASWDGPETIRRAARVAFDFLAAHAKH